MYSYGETATLSTSNFSWFRSSWRQPPRMAAEFQALTASAPSKVTPEPTVQFHPSIFWRWFYTGSMLLCTGWLLSVPALTSGPASRSSPTQARFRCHNDYRHDICQSRSCTISRNKINFLFVRLSFTFQTWASATLGQLFSSKSFSGATENFLHGANRSLEWTFFRHCPKSRSSVCPDYLNRLHDFLGVDPSNLRMAGVRKLHFMIISIYRWSAFSTSTQWSWIPILWQWSCTCPGEIKIPQLLVA